MEARLRFEAGVREATTQHKRALSYTLNCLSTHRYPKVDSIFGDATLDDKIFSLRVLKFWQRSLLAPKTNLMCHTTVL